MLSLKLVKIMVNFKNIKKHFSEDNKNIFGNFRRFKNISYARTTSNFSILYKSY